MTKSKGQKHPADGNGSKKSGIQRKADKGVVPKDGKLGNLKRGSDAATRNARGFWAQQGGKAATGERIADNSRKHGEK
jgi:hypothetical protein